MKSLEHPPAAELRDASAKPQSDERRKLLRAGLSAAPVVMTVASKPVLGSTICAAASAMGSAGSATARTASVCNGLTPSQWKTYAAEWPLPYCATNASRTGSTATRYHCPTTGFSGHIFGDHTMLEVIDIGQGGIGTMSLGGWMVAALLNACCGRTPVLNETGVRTMWNDVVNNGYYEPTAGVKWQAPEIIAYLKTTMG
ncbi:MAG TPA: hypothetical protein VKV24_18890 [Casimicrobiaceae bacterium]|nr:hypothetical protein [Casimicrobiaceae bacterium]